MKPPLALVILSFIGGTTLVAGAARAQLKPLGKSAAPFPSQHFKEVHWIDSLAKGIQEAGRAKKPICLILAGRRPSGDC